MKYYKDSNAKIAHVYKKSEKYNYYNSFPKIKQVGSKKFNVYK